jgi:hypothetical protein
MAPSRKANDLKAKEAKQKKILIGAVVLLAILMFVQMPKLLHRGGNVAAAPPIAASAATDPAAVPVGSAPLAPPALASATGATAVPTDASGLADTDPAPTAAAGQLVQFDLFESKDPFAPQVTDPAATGSTVAPSSDAGPSLPSGVTRPSASAVRTKSAGDGSPGGITGAPGATAPSAPDVPTTAVVRISVNGVTETVQAKGSFPAAAPMFQVKAITPKSLSISILDGGYQNGAPALALAKGRAVTLMNTADGTKYRLVYVGMANVPTSSLPAPVAPTTTSATPTAVPAATAPTATTPIPAATAPTAG